MSEEIRGNLKLGEPMSRHTSWRVGGPADRFYRPADRDDLARFMALQDAGEPLVWLGLGSNVLVRDRGIRGTVIVITGVLDQLDLTEQRTLKAGAGVTNAKVARFAANAGLAGAEFLAGIPGTLGGALAMNAGAFGYETWDIVNTVETINRKGELQVRGPAEFEIDYRRVSLPGDEWFVGCELMLGEDHDRQALNRIREFLSGRARTQPVNEPTCGSVFKNPPGDYAARLIEASGLKGMRIGGACVSEKHANFIINKGTASAADIEQLIAHIHQVVAERYGVKLEKEVRIIGE